MPRDSGQRVGGGGAELIRNAISEIERLLGDTTARRGRWPDLHRHLSFSLGHDWHDIAEFDWPSVRRDIEAASLSDADPLPVPDLDLGAAASTHPTGGATTGLDWSAIDDDGFERLVFDLLRQLPGYQNVEWFMKTRAPDRGRDVSFERVICDSGGTIRTERGIAQAKHWSSMSVAPVDVTTTLAGLKLLEPPVVRVLVIVTSGRFTADAVELIENHNNEGHRPFIEPWPDSRLEVLLAQHPGLAASHRLQPVR